MTRSKTVGVATRPQQIVIFWYIGSNLSSKSIKAVTHPIHTKRQETEPMQNKRPENKNVNKSYAFWLKYRGFCNTLICAGCFYADFYCMFCLMECK